MNDLHSTERQQLEDRLAELDAQEAGHAETTPPAPASPPADPPAAPPPPEAEVVADSEPEEESKVPDSLKDSEFYCPACGRGFDYPYECRGCDARPGGDPPIKVVPVAELDKDPKEHTAAPPLPGV